MRLVISVMATALAIGACGGGAPPGEREEALPLTSQWSLVADNRSFAAFDDAGRPIDALQVGSTLYVGARDLNPRAMYEFRVGVGEDPTDSMSTVSFARLAANAQGEIAPLALWYHSGVVGCSLRDARATLARFVFQDFEQAAGSLVGNRLHLTVREVGEIRAGERLPADIGSAATLVEQLELSVVERSKPLLYPSTDDGCLLNSAPVGVAEAYVSGWGFAPDEQLLLSVVANQRQWREDDRVRDLTGVAGAPQPVRVSADQQGSFTQAVWAPSRQRIGAYDFIAQRVAESLQEIAFRDEDVASYGIDTAFLMFASAPDSGVPTTELAGRPIPYIPPYFQFSDAFATEGDNVWAAVDPTIVPAGHPGGKYAAYYVVSHRDVDGWDPANGGSASLADVSGGIEIMPVKAGCINVTQVPIWNGPLPPGEYDVVVDFGDTPAETATEFVSDGQYDPDVDFLDGADRIGFVTATDPHAFGEYAIGEASYSSDNRFPTLGTAPNVDLRAVVRYPAVSAGPDTEVSNAKTRYPIFFIQHGWHSPCEVLTFPDGIKNYWEARRDVADKVMTWDEFNAAEGDVDAESCTERTPNHEGYVELLDLLASHGIIAVSLDAYDLLYDEGVMSGYIPEGGKLILKHMELWAHLNDPTVFTEFQDLGLFGGRFQDRVDMKRIALAGHSRGAAYAIEAYLLNKGRPDPFEIGAFAGIAPADPFGDPLLGVPFFVLIPAADGDQWSLPGMRTFDRASQGASPTAPWNKSGIYMYGANHNFFNTVWGAHWDDSWPGRDDELSAADQLRIGNAYLAAFARIHLNDESIYEEMLRGRLIFPSVSGFPIYYFRREDKFVRFEEGGAAPTTPSDIPGSITRVPTNLALAVATGVDLPAHATNALKLSWTATDAQLEYEFPGPPNVADAEVLSFRVARAPAAGAGPLNFLVELGGGGKVWWTYAGQFDEIPAPYDRKDYQAGDTAPAEVTDYAVMTTVRIPLRSFTINNSGVDLADITEIRFSFNVVAPAEVYIDDIEFTR